MLARPDASRQLLQKLKKTTPLTPLAKKLFDQLFYSKVSAAQVKVAY